MINVIETFCFEVNNNRVSISLSSNDSLENNLVKDSILDYLNQIDKTKNLYLTYKINRIDQINKKVFALINDNKNISFSFDNDCEYYSNGEKVYYNVNDDRLTSNGRAILFRTSINLARLGINNQNKSLDDFYNELSETLDFVKSQMIQRFDFVGNSYRKNLPNIFRYNF